MDLNVLFHGSYMKIEKPDIKAGRVDVDFGLGFYTTEDEFIAKKWACKYNQSVVNEYYIDMSQLNVLYLNLDKEWLDIIRTFRSGEEYEFNEKYDVIVGPIADDKLFTTLDMYDMGLLDVSQAIKVMNCMNYGMQTVFKTEKALDQLKYSSCKIYMGAERQHFKDMFLADSKEASNKAMEMIRSFRR